MGENTERQKQRDRERRQSREREDRRDGIGKGKEKTKREKGGEKEKTHAGECYGTEGDRENWLFSWRQPGVSGGGDFEALTGAVVMSRAPFFYR